MSHTYHAEPESPEEAEQRRRIDVQRRWNRRARAKAARTWVDGGERYGGVVNMINRATGGSTHEER